MYDFKCLSMQWNLEPNYGIVNNVIDQFKGNSSKKKYYQKQLYLQVFIRFTTL